MMNFTDFLKHIAESDGNRRWLAPRCVAAANSAAAVAWSDGGALCVVWFGPSRRALPELPEGQWAETATGYRVEVPAAACGEMLKRRFPEIAPRTVPDTIRPRWFAAPGPAAWREAANVPIFPIFPDSPELPALALANAPAHGYGTGTTRRLADGIAGTGGDSALRIDLRDSAPPPLPPEETARVVADYAGWTYLDAAGTPVRFADAAEAVEAAADARALHRMLPAKPAEKPKIFIIPRHRGAAARLALERECKLLKLKLDFDTGE